jgi:ankyrin repeat protein
VRKGDPIADINSTGIENRTALHCAVYENRVEAAKLLLKHGASPDAKTVHHRTPLHVACILGEDEMVKLLLASGSTVCSQDYEKNTPVHYAAYYSKLQ